MKKIFKLTGITAVAALALAMGFSGFGGNSEAKAAELSNVLMDGTVISVEAGQLHMNRIQEGFSEEVVVTISDDTLVLDGVNGYPIPLENLEKGEAVRVYAGPAMTMSLPPITNGVLVMSDVPADAGFPVYGTVESLVQKSGADGEYILTTADGNTYTVNSSTTLLPYLTRNIVTAADMTPGTQILLWTDAGNAGAAAKIVIFQGSEGYGTSAENGNTAEVSGWEKTDEGWYFYENGQAKKGWLYEGGDWYFLNPETGLMQTGFVTVDGRTYFLKEDGRMLTEESIFVPDENGALHLKTK